MYILKRFLFNYLGLVFIIFLLGSYLRFNNLADNPPSLNWDEVSFAYNAHSILETGKDEFGKSFPLYFEALDDYKLPVYVYSAVLSEKIFGYNNFAVRFPSAFFGSLTILIVFFLTDKLFKNKNTALIAALLFAVIPWHIQFSRMAAEATVGLFFFLTGILLFYSGLKKNKYLLIFSFLFFALSQYTYLSFRIITPLLAILLLILYRKNIFKKNIFVYTVCILAIVFNVLLAFDIYAHRNNSRMSGIAAITPYTPEFLQDIDELVVDGKLGINLERKLFHDYHIFSSINIVGWNYLSHFSPNFLFFNLGQTRHYTPTFGLLYLWMLPFIVGGLYLITNLRSKPTVVIWSLILLPPLPAAFAFDAPNTIRTIALAVPFCILTAFAINFSGKILMKLHKIYYAVFLAVMSLFIFGGTYYFYHQNTIHLPQERSHEWQYGRQEMTRYILENKHKYDKIIVSTKLEWPNIFYLYYSKYDPGKYLVNGGTINGSWSAEMNKIENIEFHKFNLSMDRAGGRVLFAGTPDEFPKEIKPLYKINYLDGNPAIYFAD